MRLKQISHPFVIACTVAGVLSLSACVAPQHYVDPALGETPASTLKKPQDPQAVQLLFEFRTKGVPNARATAAVKQRVHDEVAHSGIFSMVSTEPVPSGRKLAISIDNVPSEGASQKGFVTGLTFGLDGNTVSDNYVCTFTYFEPGHDKVTKEVHHVIYTTVGVTKAPQGLTPVSVQDALTTMLRQAVDKGLEEIDEASDLAE